MFPRAPEAEEFARQGIDTLARLPFTPQIGQAAANGSPIAGSTDSPLAEVFQQLASDCAAELVARQRRLQQ